MKEMSSAKKILFIGALLLTTIVMMGDSLITPASSTLYSEFSNEAGVNLLLSMPTLIATFASILFGILSTKFDKKALLLIGMICFTVSGVCGVMINSLPYMIAMRFILGVGMGAANVCTISIISQVFTDEIERSRYTSFVTAGTSFCGIILTSLSGAIAEIFGWRSVFYIHWIGVIIIILIIFNVPKCPPLKENDEEKDDNSVQIPRQENIKKWPLHFVALIGSQFVWYIMYGLVFFQIAVYVSERGIGNEAFSGAMFSVVSTVAFIFCLLFSIVYKYVKRACPVIFFGTFALAFIVLMMFGSKVSTIAACIIFGLGTGIGLSYFAFRGTIIVPKERMSIAVTIYSATMGIGMSLSTYVAMAIKAILHTGTFVSMLPVLSVVATVGAILSVILTINDKKHPARYYLEENKQNT